MTVSVSVALSMAVSPLTYGAKAPTEDSLFYYKIGGGRNISLPPSLDVTTIDLSFSAQANVLSCSGFDPTIAIEQSLDNLKNGVDDAVNAVENAASAAIANLPGYILQKANPGLYDLFQNALLRANESLKIATKSCERVQYEIANNTNPFDEWITVSWGDSWKQSVGVGGANIHDAVKAAETAPEDGVRWVGGSHKGGNNQAPILVISDVAVAGLNLLSQRAADDDSALPDDAPLAPHFDSPASLRAWVGNVLGEVEVGLCAACQKGARPGKGLQPKIEQSTESHILSLEAFITGAQTPTRLALDTVEAPGIAMTLQVIEALRNLPSSERAIVTQKLAKEISEARVLEQAMMVRRLLLSGRKEINVATNKLAQTEIDRTLKELDTEINNVLFEKDIRQKLVNSTIVELLMLDRSTRLSSMGVPTQTHQDSRPLTQGAVKQ